VRYRLQDSHRAKRYIWSLILTLILWVITISVIVFVDPESMNDSLMSGTHLMFLVPFGLAVWFSASLILANSKLGAIIAIGLIISAYLRMIEIGSWWILVPWWGVIGSLFVFVAQKNRASKVDKEEAS
jgi:hypothetical protein